MRILSLDLALANIGWTIWRNEELINFGTFENPKITDKLMPDLAFRSIKAFEFIDAILKYHFLNHNNFEIVIERPHGSRNIKAAACMGVCASICGYINHKHVHKINYIEPMEMKKWLKTFYVFPQKKDPKLLAKEVAKKLGYDIDAFTEHEIDSICIYRCYMDKHENNI